MGDDLQGVAETQAIGVDLCELSGLQHGLTIDIVSQQQAIQPLDHSHRFLAAQRGKGFALMVIDFIVGDFDLLALMIELG